MCLRIDHSWYLRRPGAPEHKCAGGIVYRMDGNEIFIALVKEENAKNCFLPKGKLEKGESPEEAARREIYEETGISELNLEKELGVRERFDFSKKSWKHIVYYLFSTRQNYAVPTDKKHKYSLIWARIDMIPEIFWPEQAELLKDFAETFK